MTTLRETTKRRLVATLEKSHFTAVSFDIQYSTDAIEFLRINFLPDQSFYLVASDRYGNYKTEECPGILRLDSEIFEHKTLEDCLKAVGPWCSRILEEYRTRNPLLDEFEILKKTIAEQIQKHTEDLGSHFTREEAAGFSLRLDELSVRLAELTDKSSEQERLLREAQAEIKALKGDLEIFPRGVWLRMAGSKIVNLVKKVATSPEGRELALSAAKKMLQLDGPK